MATFTAEVFQNEFLADGTTEVHAIVSVRCDGAGSAGQLQGPGGGAAEIIIIDSSGSMEHPQAKMKAARQAAQVALDEILDGTMFAVIAGSNSPGMVYPQGSRGSAMAKMDAHTRAEAKLALARVRGNGGTAIGSWLRAAVAVFNTTSATQRHAMLTCPPSS